jgi:hypothetical protein
VTTLYPKLSLRNFTFINAFHQQLLTDLPARTVLGCFTDTACFNLLYQQEVNGLRPDVTILPAAYPLVMKRLQSQPDLHGFDYKNDPFLTLDYLTWNIGKRPVYVTDLSQVYYNLLGMSFGFTYYIPHGYVGELTRDVPKTMPTANYAFSDEMKAISVPQEDTMRVWFKMTLARLHYFNAAAYLKMGYRDLARDELNRYSDLLYQLPQVSRDDIESARIFVESQSPTSNFAPGSQVQPVEEILKNIDNFISRGKISMARSGALGLVAIDPKNELGRLKLAEIYEQIGDKNFALIEYKNVLKYYPGNSKAQQKVKQLELPQ